MSWQKGLLASMTDPNLVLINTENLVVIKDMFPKARHHFLVLPHSPPLNSIFELRSNHKQLIKEMEFLGFNAIEVVGGNLKDFKMGFHFAPSLHRLHLHVISTDFISDRLKTKTHWNSFNTSFFLTVKQILDALETNGKIDRLGESEVKKLLSTELVCNQCNYRPKNMPDLKNHLLTHRK
jgi:aprataxin